MTEHGTLRKLRIPWGSLPVWVRFPRPAPIASDFHDLAEHFGQRPCRWSNKAESIHKHYAIMDAAMQREAEARLGAWAQAPQARNA